MILTEQEKLLVTRSFYQIVPISDRAAEKFYSRLFEISPEVQPLFKKTDMGDQRKKMIDMIAMVVYSLDNLSKVASAIKKLGERHKTYGVKKEDYDKVASAFLWMLENELGSDYTPTVHAAWKSTFTLIAETTTEGIYD